MRINFEIPGSFARGMSGDTDTIWVAAGAANVDIVSMHENQIHPIDPLITVSAAAAPKPKIEVGLGESNSGAFVDFPSGVRILISANFGASMTVKARFVDLRVQFDIVQVREWKYEVCNIKHSRAEW